MESNPDFVRFLLPIPNKRNGPQQEQSPAVVRISLAVFRF